MLSGPARRQTCGGRRANDPTYSDFLYGTSGRRHQFVLVVLVRVAQNWFDRFQSHDFDVKDEPRSGRPVTDKVDAILEKVKQDRHISYDIAEELGIDYKTVLIHLKEDTYKKKARHLDPTGPH
ncbi:Putative uncharacterized protein FLJ37770 [Eumeta japonica]|uniref:Histone-lysine N-methyltransferase SETMAR n=1 Tax=Eumeta variegata TaxID=151549 RepID=A0A4C1Z6L3_EUMVA|nr:Putative uncharacterized protein FLJ37770 [Eumeta japonica]